MFIYLLSIYISITVWIHFARSNSYTKFVSFEIRDNWLSIKTKARQLHKQNIFRLRVTENFQTRTESEQKSQLPKQSWKNEDHEKKEKQETEREKKNIRHMFGKGNLSQYHASLDLTMEDKKQTFLHQKIKHKQVGDSKWQVQLGHRNLAIQADSQLARRRATYVFKEHSHQPIEHKSSQLAIVALIQKRLRNIFFHVIIVAKLFWRNCSKIFPKGRSMILLFLECIC